MVRLFSCEARRSHSLRQRAGRAGRTREQHAQPGQDEHSDAMGDFIAPDAGADTEDHADNDC